MVWEFNNLQAQANLVVEAGSRDKAELHFYVYVSVQCTLDCSWSHGIRPLFFLNNRQDLVELNRLAAIYISVFCE